MVIGSMRYLLRGLNNKIIYYSANQRKFISFKSYPPLDELLKMSDAKRLEMAIELCKQILPCKTPNWNYLTHLLQILSTGAITNKEATLKDILIESMNIAAKSAIDEIENKIDSDCPSRIYYESLRGLSNYHNAACSYPLGIYPIYQPNYFLDVLAEYSEIPFSDPDKPLIDVVIIHGINGSPFRTWRFPGIPKFKNASKIESPRDMCWYWLWPREILAREFPNIRVIAIEYHSRFIKINKKYPWVNGLAPDKNVCLYGEWDEDFQTLESGDIFGVAAKFGKKLRQAGVGDNPFLILGHSFGGIITQLMLLSDPQLINNLHAIVGYAVPYLGSNRTAISILNMLKVIGLEFSETVKKISDDAFVDDLLRDFSKLVDKRMFKIYTYEETIKTRVPKLGIDAFIVDQGKAKPPFTDEHFSPPQACHNDVCKPKGRDDIRYKPLANIIYNLTHNRK